MEESTHLSTQVPFVLLAFVSYLTFKKCLTMVVGKRTPSPCWPDNRLSYSTSHLHDVRRGSSEQDLT